MQFELISGEDQRFSRAWQYADGFFTTLRVECGGIFLKQKHLERIEASAKALGLSVDAEELLEVVEARTKDQSVGVKLVVERQNSATRGYGSLVKATNVWAAEFELPQKSLTGREWIYMNAPVACVLLSSRVTPRTPKLQGLKTLDRTEQVLAANELMELRRTHANPLLEGVLVNQHRMLCEGVSSNLVYRADGQWYTPCMSQGGVCGTFRQRLVELGLVQVAATTHEIDALESAMLINSVRGMQGLTGLETKEHLRQFNTALSYEFAQQVAKANL